MNKLAFMIGLLCSINSYSAVNNLQPTDKKVSICHYPPGNKSNVQLINISSNSLPAHYWDGVKGSGHEYDEEAVNGKCPGQIKICDNGITETISQTDWNPTKEGKTYYLGTCNMESDSSALPNKSALPEKQDYKVDEWVMNNAPRCLDNSTRSIGVINNAIIKRTTISNVTVTDGTVSLENTSLKYGIKTPNVGSVDLTNATVVNNRATGVKLTGITLTDIVVYSSIDFIDANGIFNPNGNWITVTGGTVQNDDHDILTTGIVVSGRQADEPVRGRIYFGKTNSPIDSPNEMKARRITGTLTNAVISNARITTVDGVTVVDEGKIESGSFTSNQAFGNIENIKLSNVEVDGSVTCFNRGDGRSGQLNWKEVVKQ